MGHLYHICNKLPRGKQTKDKVPFSMGRVWNLKYTLPCPAMIETGARSRNRETNKYRWSSTKDSEYITLGPQNMVRLTSSTEHSVSLTSCLLVSELISLLVCCVVFFFGSIFVPLPVRWTATAPARRACCVPTARWRRRCSSPGWSLCCAARPGDRACAERRRRAGERGVS